MNISILLTIGMKNNINRLGCHFLKLFLSLLNLPFCKEKNGYGGEGEKKEENKAEEDLLSIYCTICVLRRLPCCDLQLSPQPLISLRS